MNRRTAVTLTLVGMMACVSGAGCAGQRREPPPMIAGSGAALRSVCRSVVRIDSPTVVGTAIVIDDHRLLTCRHVLPETLLGPAIELGGGLSTRRAVPVATVRIDGRPRRVRLMAVGESEAPDDDWAVLEVVGAALDQPPARLDGNRELRTGEAALAIGFWRGPNDGAIDPAKRRRWIVRTRVAEPVPFDRATQLISIVAPQQHSYNGLSGGAVVVWDEPSEEFVVVGVYFGFRRWEMLGVRLFELLTARRVPPEAAPGCADKAPNF